MMSPGEIIEFFGLEFAEFNALSYELKDELTSVPDDDYMALHHLGYKVYEERRAA